MPINDILGVFVMIVLFKGCINCLQNVLGALKKGNNFVILVVIT